MKEINKNKQDLPNTTKIGVHTLLTATNETAAKH